MSALEIRSDLKIQLDHLAAASHRDENDLANEAVALYLAQHRRITARILEGWEQAQRREFVSDEEMEKFFAHYTD